MFKSLLAPVKPYVDESKLDPQKVVIRTRLPVIVTLTTIPARMSNVFRIIKHFLEKVQDL